jgi:hypothetical protein
MKKNHATGQLVSGLTLGVAEDVWDFLEDDNEVEEDGAGSTMDSLPEPDPYIEPKTEDIEKVRDVVNTDQITK